MVMDLFQLTYFIEVAHKKSFTKASKSLHISQPSISKGIKALEEHWNVQLFDRKGKNIELTEMGAYLLPKIENLVKNFNQLNEEMESPQLLNAGKLAIGIPPTVGFFISPFIKQFIATYPNIKLELREVGSYDVVSAIDNGLIQAGIVALPINTKMPYDFYIFKEENLRVVLWPNHPLSDRQSLSLMDIKDESLVYFPPSFSLNTYTRSFFQQLMVQPKVVCHSSNWEFLVELVSTHLGITLLPDSICKRISPDKAVSIPLVNPEIPWTLAMIWKSKGFLSHPARTWVQSFKDYFKDTPASPQA